MPRFRVLLTDRAWPDPDVEREILAEIDAELVEPSAEDEATLIEAARGVDAIGTCWAKVTAPVVEAAPDCRIVTRYGIGLDNIAVDTATERGIPVVNVPDYCVIEVAEHAFAMLLACARKITFYDRRAKHAVYELQAGASMRRIAGKTLGLVGFGHTARNLRERALAFGLNVVAHSPSGNDYGTGCTMRSLEDVLAESDFVSVHAPLTEATRRLINAETLTLMKPTAFLINTSRGGLVDEAALWDAVNGGRLAGAALDVFDPEPPDLSQPLFRDDRVIVTPHAAFLSEESLIDLRVRATRAIVDALAGREPPHVVNPDHRRNR